MSQAEEIDAEIEGLLDYIRTNRGVDLTGYKRPTLMRRINRRMSEVKIDSVVSYQDLLEADVDEFTHLFDTILINVTSFFRDKQAWDFIASDVVPDILEHKAPDEPIRVWSAGCASGEEAYTIAMILAEALAADELRDMVKIYATDIDNNALAQARQGVYEPKDLADVPDDLRNRYFEEVGTHVSVRHGLRRAVIFGRHDLTEDPPIGRLDLLVCRNTLMYFNAESQSRILNRFNFALGEDGYLFLGKAEMLLSHGKLFSPVNMKHRVFRKTNNAVAAELLGTGVLTETEPLRARATRQLTLRELALDSAPVAVVLVDSEGIVGGANAEARSLFRLGPLDIGQPLKNLELSYRPVELRAHLDEISRERRAVHLHNVEHALPDGKLKYLDVIISPLLNPGDVQVGTSISFTDVTASQHLRQELQHSREDLETTFEELRSTNEELETTNEELQSSNEELETTNEELQSTNEELETTNEEIRIRAIEVETLNERLHSLLSSMMSGVIMLDRELLVELWNDTAEDLWGLRSEEAEGRSIAALDIGLPAGPLQTAIRDCLDGRSEREVAVVDGLTRTGRPTRFRVVCTPIATPGPPTGVVLVIDALESS